MSSIVVILCGEITVKTLAKPDDLRLRLAHADVLSASLDAGYTIGNVLIFFAFAIPGERFDRPQHIWAWRGSTIYTNTYDFVGVVTG
jgi:hypothetical protein